MIQFNLVKLNVFLLIIFEILFLKLLFLKYVNLEIYISKFKGKLDSEKKLPRMNKILDSWKILSFPPA